MNKEDFIKELKKLNINISQEQLKKLDDYYKLLVEWNNRINLTRIIEESDVYLKHYYDSITLIKAIPINNQSICDFGTGAGFPGIVLKIIFPNIKLTLVDSLNKRIIFLNEVIKQLNLTNITVINERGEIYSRLNRSKFDIVTSRAVANLMVLSEICLPMVKTNGLFIPLKGTIKEELINTSYLKKLNSEIKNIINFNLPNNGGERNIIVIQKNQEIDQKYPRNYDKIIKKPL